MGVRVSADLIRDVAQALDTLEPLERDETTTVGLLLDKPIRFTSEHARRENNYEFKVFVRYDETASLVDFEVVL